MDSYRESECNEFMFQTTEREALKMDPSWSRKGSSKLSWNGISLLSAPSWVKPRPKTLLWLKGFGQDTFIITFEA